MKSHEFTSDTLKIELKSESDVLHNNEEGDGNMRYWYGNSFYVFGRQSIKSKNNDGNVVRHIYFINKLETD
jgi:hypothetical protein